MTARRTRFAFNTVNFITIISGIVGIVLILIASNLTDYYVEIGEIIVPGNMDLKISHFALIAMIVALLGIYIIQNGDFSAMYDLRKVPVYCTNEVNMRMKNAVFKRQINESLGSYYNSDWGILCDEDKDLNDEAVESGTDRVLATYTTIYGEIYIITEADRSATTILFAREY